MISLFEIKAITKNIFHHTGVHFLTINELIIYLRKALILIDHNNEVSTRIYGEHSASKLIFYQRLQGQNYPFHGLVSV